MLQIASSKRSFLRSSSRILSRHCQDSLQDIRALGELLAEPWAFEGSLPNIPMTFVFSRPRASYHAFLDMVSKILQSERWARDDCASLRVHISMMMLLPGDIAQLASAGSGQLFIFTSFIRQQPALEQSRPYYWRFTHARHRTPRARCRYSLRRGRRFIC